MFTCNCFITDGLAVLRQAERMRQPRPGSNFQIRRKDETHRLNERIRREDFEAGEHKGMKLRLGRPRAALVWMQTEAMPRVVSRAGARGSREEGSG
jgi:hypothetical protein